MKTRKKNKPGQGRKPEGRVRRIVLMLPEGWAAVEADMRGRGDSLGRAIERKFGIPNLTPAAAPYGPSQGRKNNSRVPQK